MFTIALVNQKGGVGKSTTAVNLSAGLSRLGKKVLLIDLDPQAHSTVSMGLQPKKLRASVYSVLAGQTRTRDAILPVTETLSILPATIDLAAGEAELASQPNAQYILKNAMAGLDNAYDYAIVDSPPQLGFLNINSLAWVKEVFIPVTCEFYALHGLSLLMETVERVKAKLNPDLKISGVIPCQFNPRRALTRDVLADLERHFPGRVTKAKIRVNVRLAEAPSHGMNIFDYAPDSNGAKDYAALALEMIERSPNAELPPLLQTAEEAPSVEAVREPSVEAPKAEAAVDAIMAAPAVEAAPIVVDEAPKAEAVVEQAKADPIPVIEEPAYEPEPIVVAIEAPAPGAEVEPEPQPEAVVCVAVEATPVEAAAEAAAEAPAPEIPFTPPTMGRVEEPTVMNLPQPASEPEPFVMIDSAPAYVEPEPPAAPVRAAVVAPAPAAAAPRTTLGTTPMAQKFGGMNGLKPIVTHRPGIAPPPPAKKGISGFFGKLLNRK